VYLLQGECCLRLGQLTDAHSYVGEALKLLRGAAEPGLLHTLVTAAAIARQVRRFDEAEDHLRRATALSDNPTYPRIMSEARAVLAQDLYALGSAEAADRELRLAEELCGSGHSAGLELHLARGKQLERLGRFGPASEEYMAAQRLAQKRQSRFELALTRLERVPAAVAAGRLGYAHAMLLDTELAFESFGAQLSLGRTYCGWVRLFLASGNHLAAAAVLQQAAAIAQRAGADTGLQFSADLAWAREAAAAGAAAASPSEAKTPPPILHPGSTLG
jgi:hypothetical protein